MKQLSIFQSMWGMEFDRPDGFQWTLEQKIQKIAEAGFAGVSFDVPHHNQAFVQQAQPLLKECGLKSAFNVFVNSSDSYRTVTQWASELDCPPEFIGIIGQISPWNTHDVAQQTREWMAIGQAAGIPTHVEVHRNCMTNDFLFTLQLMDEVPDLLMVADLSHALVNQEWYLPLSQDAQQLVSRFLQRTQAFHGRVGTREQAQVALSFPQHQPWFELFQSWWLEGFRSWQARNASTPDARCVFVCELGPPPYAITGADGHELSDRWQDALILKGTAERLWEQALSTNTMTALQES
ncbi:sugar phosphate isomerase/epimerase [Aestuariicella hydrocarbonica]|uniref:Sugar phosphate isomerase/epimerase n=1 Tax=Pseudomaricurvus hydrocarbonicus TaxID=1470433 RepID=A0A9E5JZX8_9GAMM|nr:sugar phosphate isomerase/epimerase [Aestuariicella hydrocarbonica]NHO65837.1 sugar phosphate isomerase/epimerase [Aestuariicella hydrocarbonica]